MTDVLQLEIDALGDVNESAETGTCLSVCVDTISTEYMNLLRKHRLMSQNLGV